jgi:predicted ATPase/DNA-binding XRE family transcriptional regulator
MAQEYTFPEMVKRCRKHLGLTQSELADQVGCSAVTIRKIEAGQRHTSREMAERLANYLRIPPDERAPFIEAAIGRVASRHLFKRTHTNLPTHLPALIGRERESRALHTRLQRPDMRLLVLVGPPGIGKTHLSIQVASEVADSYEDGVFFINLAAVRSYEFVAAAIAQVIGLQGTSPLLAEDMVAEALRDKQILLILDNFEHVIVARSLVATLLKECLWLTIIVTSQEPLRIRGETLFAVPALELPAMAPLPPLPELAGYSAIRLFVDRAQAMDPEFQLTAHNAQAIAALCTQLDGLPLAIELVAPHIHVLSPRMLLERLTSRLELTLPGPADLPDRHQTLRAAIDWGYELLSPPEKSLFRKLAVFSESWTLGAAEYVGADGGSADVVTLLTALVNKSLIVKRDSRNGDLRFRMLATIRSYAVAALQQTGQVEAIKERHAQYYASLAAQLVATAQPEQTSLILEGLTEDHGNINAALQWALEHGAATVAIQLAEILWRLQIHLNEALTQSRAANLQLEDIVAERTASLQMALRLGEERERKLTLLNDELLQAKHAVEEAHYLKTRFLSNMSYEFRTILNVIINFSYFLSETPADSIDDLREFFHGRLQANAEYLLGLINDIVDLSEIEMGSLKLRYETVDLTRLLPEICATARAFSKEKQISIGWHVAASTPAVLADARRIRQILLNLLWCVAKLTASQQMMIQIWSDADGMIYCAIHDQEQILDSSAYARVLQTTSPYQEGPIRALNDVSLRLSIGQTFIVLHGGDLRVILNEEQNMIVCTLPPPASVRP